MAGKKGKKKHCKPKSINDKEFFERIQKHNSCNEPCSKCDHFNPVYVADVNYNGSEYPCMIDDENHSQPVPYAVTTLTTRIEYGNFNCDYFTYKRYNTRKNEKLSNG